MAGWNELQAAIAAGHLDDATISAAIDAHQERFDKGLARAVVCVGFNVQTLIQSAAEKISALNKTGVKKTAASNRGLLERAAGAGDSFDLPIEMVAGNTPPCYEYTNETGESTAPAGLHIQVGVAWIMQQIIIHAHRETEDSP